MSPEATVEPVFGFEDSRRLPGPNRYFGSPAVTLTALGSQALDPQVLADWALRARAMAAQLAWPDPQPLVVRRARAVLLLLRAPVDALFTATGGGLDSLPEGERFAGPAILESAFTTIVVDHAGSYLRAPSGNLVIMP